VAVEEPKSPLKFALAIVPGTLLAGIAGGIVFPIFPIVGQRVGLSVPFIGAILAANRAVRVLSSPFIGRTVDRIGARRTMLIGLAVQVVVMALFLAGMVTHHEGAGFLSGRLLHGIGSACVFVSAQALALKAGGSDKGGGTAGLVRAAIVVGIPVGLSAGGLLSDAVGEVLTFAIAGGAVALAFIGASFTLPVTQVSTRPRPAFSETLGELHDRRLLSVGGLNFALTFSAGGMVLTTMALLVDGRHLSLFGRNAQGTAGLMMGLLSVVDAVSTPFMGRLGDRLRGHAQVATVSAAGIVVALLVIGASSTTGGTAAGVALLGVGTAGLGPSLLVLMGKSVSGDRHGSAAGLMQLFSDVGGMAGPLIGTGFFAHDLSLGCFAAAGLMAVFIPVAWSLRRVEAVTAPK
jgi:MFS family permease